MRTISPLTQWREQSGITIAELADLCNVTEADIVRVETGEDGLIGEIQDCLTQRGENVSQMASDHADFLVSLRGEIAEASIPPIVRGLRGRGK
jgi:hypothetical protein